jgi:uncharacterized protein YeaO (DUF488 family)
VNIYLKRAYATASPQDGERYLVDRLWPRGVKKEALPLTAWLKDIAPSTGLRRWYRHEVARWKIFRRRYRAELILNSTAAQPLREAVARGAVTLVYSAHDEAHNQAVVLRDFLLEAKPALRRTKQNSKN